MSNPIIGIIMGSDSDLPVMIQAKKVCDEFSIEAEIHVLSAHRSPAATIDYARSAESRGLKLIIAGAGSAAHLAGIVASSTILPVIGVPVSGSALNGYDSLLSTVQMPPGIPVATVAIDGARNAGILALEILATSDEQLKLQLHAFKKKLSDEVKKKNEDLGPKIKMLSGKK